MTLPRYQQSRVITAARILSVNAKFKSITVEDAYGQPQTLQAAEWAREGDPSVGDYFVEMEDGSRSWIEADAIQAWKRMPDEEIPTRDFNKMLGGN